MTEHLPSKSIEPAGETGSVLAVLKAAAEESPEILTGVAAEVHPLLGKAIQLFHAQSKGSFLRQLGVLLEELRKKGTIKDDYLKTQQARDCLNDLLAFVDRETPDSKRLDAAHKVFANMATEKLSTREDPLPQQLLQIVMGLSAGELLLLSAVANAKDETGDRGLAEWRRRAAAASGLVHPELVDIHYESLRKKHLLSEVPQMWVGRPQAWSIGQQLTDLGKALCKFIITSPGTA